MREKRTIPTVNPDSQPSPKRARKPIGRIPVTAAPTLSSDSSDGTVSTPAKRVPKKPITRKIARPKAHPVAGPSPQLRPAPSQLHGKLDFVNKDHKLQYKKLAKLPIVPCKLIETSVLPTLNVMPKVSEYLNAIGWGRLIDYKYPIYMELVQEFYATFSCKLDDNVTGDTPVVKFRLLGKSFHMSLIQLNVALGMIDSMQDASVLVEAIGGYTSKFKMDRQSFWQELINDKSDSHIANKSKAFNIVDPALRIIHTWLGHSLSARPRGTNVVSKMELCLLWCMKNNKRADFARWLVKQFESVVTYMDRPQQRGLSLGIYITRIAVHEGLLDLNNTNLYEIHRVEDMIMDTTFYLSKHIIRMKGEDLEFTPPGTSVSGPVVSQGAAVEVPQFMANMDRQEENDRWDDMYKRLEALEQGQKRIIELLEKRASLSPTSDSTPPSTG